MPSLQELQHPIDVEICAALAASVAPASWKVIVLSLWREPQRQAVGQLLHAITSPEGHAPVAATDALNEATRKLDALLQAHNAVLARATYTVHTQGEDMRFQTEFSYLDQRASAERAAADATASRSWWQRLVSTLGSRLA
ncbi:MAG: hypothetical protein RL701_3155 [Pseudomonadota bacterium]|jgi:hypothetical protein